MGPSGELIHLGSDRDTRISVCGGLIACPDKRDEGEATLGVDAASL